jgi:hypothetical protein
MTPIAPNFTLTLPPPTWGPDTTSDDPDALPETDSLTLLSTDVTTTSYPFWDVQSDWTYTTLFGNEVPLSFTLPTTFHWKDQERREAADDMLRFLSVFDRAVGLEERLQHQFKSGRRALLWQCEENCENCGEPATRRYWGSTNNYRPHRRAEESFERCDRCKIGRTVWCGGDKYFIVKKEKITPTLHWEAKQELDDAWWAIMFPDHAAFIAFTSTALRILHRHNWAPHAAFPILPPPTWNLPREEGSIA